MKKTAVFILCLITGFAFGQTPDSLVSNFVAKTGGMKAYEAITSTSLKQVSDDVKVPYEETLIKSFASKKVMKTRSVVKRNFIYVMTPSKAEVLIPTGGLNRATYQRQGLSDFEKSKMEIELNEGLWAFINFAEKGYVAKVLPGETKNEAVLELSKLDVLKTFTFDKTTGFVTKEITTYANGEKVISEYSNYMPVKGGISYPKKSIVTEGSKKRVFENTLELNAVSPTAFDI